MENTIELPRPLCELQVQPLSAVPHTGVLAQRRRGAAAYGNASQRFQRLSSLKIIRAGDAAMLWEVGCEHSFARSIQKHRSPELDRTGTSISSHTTRNPKGLSSGDRSFLIALAEKRTFPAWAQ